MAESYLIFELAGEHFGVRAHEVLRLIRHDAGQLRRPFGTLGIVQGYVPHAHGILPVIDLRLAMGFESMEAETQSVMSTMSTREREHVQWIDELEASTREGRDFRLTTNPHECNFGKWYYSLKANPAALQAFAHGNSGLTAVFNAFEEPHRRIHGLGVDVAKLLMNQQQEEALDLIDHARHTVLRQMVDLFARARDILLTQRRTLLMVVQHDHESMGLLIDQVQGLRPIDEDHMQSLSLHSELVHRMALSPGTTKPAALLELSTLYAKAQTAAA